MEDIVLIDDGVIRKCKVDPHYYDGTFIYTWLLTYCSDPKTLPSDHWYIDEEMTLVMRKII